MKVLVDTNVIVDVALERHPFYNDADEIFRLIERQEIEGYVSAEVFTTIDYIVRKVRGRDWTLQFLDRVTTICQIAVVDRAVISMALSANFADFEDAVQYCTAVVNQLNAIVTRNAQDFVAGKVQSLSILTPTSLIQQCIDATGGMF